MTTKKEYGANDAMPVVLYEKLDMDSEISYPKVSTLAIKIDDASTSGVTYIGKASIGSSTSTAVWQIMKIDESSTPITCNIQFADGNANFDNIFDNRTSLTYS